MWHYIKQAALGAFAAAGLTLVGLETYVVFDLRAFEYEPLLALLGWEGVAFILFLSLGLTVALYTCLKVLTQGKSRGDALGRPVKLFLVVWTVAALWLIEWTFMERPLTVRVAESLVSDAAKHRATTNALLRHESSGGLVALLGQNIHADRNRTALMLERIRINAPPVFDNYSLGGTIAKYAEQYRVSPIILTHWAYMTSFSGEAVSGPLPFFRQMTGETLRDLIQAHLPAWFVESSIRQWLVESRFLERVAGQSIGSKLRYAFHKSSYDISLEPFSANTFSDVYAVLHRYQEEFPELTQEAVVEDPLARAFDALKGSPAFSPLDAPYAERKSSAAQYEDYREQLISFARAVFYRLCLDFDFATKVQALVVRHYQEFYENYLGVGWASLDEQRQTALIAMSRDVYVPNIGHLSANVYILPELNLGGLHYVAEEAASAGASELGTGRLWLPREPQRLWAGSGRVLRVLSETWDIMTGVPLPGVRPEDTVSDAVSVIARVDEG